MKCLDCGKEASEGFAFCPWCGKDLKCAPQLPIDRGNLTRPPRVRAATVRSLDVNAERPFSLNMIGRVAIVAACILAGAYFSLNRTTTPKLPSPGHVDTPNTVLVTPTPPVWTPHVPPPMPRLPTYTYTFPRIEPIRPPVFQPPPAYRLPLYSPAPIIPTIPRLAPLPTLQVPRIETGPPTQTKQAITEAIKQRAKSKPAKLPEK